MGIILGLVAAIFWGAADFFARYATQRIGTYRTLFYMQLFGLAGISIYLLATGTISRFPPTDSRYWQPWLWALSTAVLSVFSTLALYRAFEVGVLTIVSPIAASSSALTLVLSFLNGEIISLVQGLGIGAALIGVVLASTSFAPTATALNAELVLRQKRKQSSGIGWALLASVGFGVIFWMLGFHVTPFLGGITPIWLIRLVAVFLLALLASPMRQTIIPPRGPVWWYVTGVGILDTAAFVIAAIALGNGQEVAIVSVLVSLFSAVTVVLAWIFLHEKLHWIQWLGICIIFVGIVLVNI